MPLRILVGLTVVALAGFALVCTRSRKANDLKRVTPNKKLHGFHAVQKKDDHG